MKVLTACECCGDSVKRLTNHDWTDAENVVHEKQVCETCNSLLNSRCDVALGSHLLPLWEYQVAYVQRRRKNVEKLVQQLGEKSSKTINTPRAEITTNLREYVVIVFGEEYKVFAPEYGFNKARYLGYKEYLKEHTDVKQKISFLMHSGKARVRVAEDRRIK